MAVLPIVRLGHPALRTRAQPLSPAQLATPAVQILIDDMIDTLHEAAGIGLAAPQVGVGLEIFVYQRPSTATGERTVVVVNPATVPLPGAAVHDWEGCLSIPGWLGWVPRHPGVQVRGMDRSGRGIDYVVNGPEARVVQHEVDHLKAILFLDRMEDLKAERLAEA